MIIKIFIQFIRPIRSGRVVLVVTVTVTIIVIITIIVTVIVTVTTKLEAY